LSCDCIERIAPLLERENMKLGILIEAPSGAVRVALPTTRLNPKGPKPRHILQATYCPFCGAPYDAKSEVTT